MNIVESDVLKRRTAYLSVISNTVLVILKLCVGLYVGAVSLVSEAMHSGVDLIAALIAFWAVRKAMIPPDQKYDYGYGKYENLSSAVEAILIVAAAVMIIYEAVDKFRAPHQMQYLQYGILIMAVSIVINIFVSRKLISVGKQTDSQALEADGLHLQSDVWTSVGVMIGLFGMHILGWYWLDPVVAILVALIIFRAGYKMIVKSTRDLTDASLSAEYEKKISTIFMKHKDVLGYHNLRTRSAGAYKMIDAHISFDSNMKLGQVHAVCDAIEFEIKKAMGPTVDVIIHPEPIEKVAEDTCKIDKKENN
ncbi:cation diffusion facilitator family transporter [Pectinatus sottacetonis]|uniref:cation diffusion facilitator family transporter n=1 Tax=Pectinatus sottacetonis TaxID=1002795 RepID=UPI001E41E771|nr:cation diffusion facilitator family transporter [Pectinatus sottacetonis]